MSILAESIHWTQKDAERQVPTAYVQAVAFFLRQHNVLDAGWSHGEVHCIAEIDSKLFHCAYEDKGTHFAPLYQREVTSY